MRSDTKRAVPEPGVCGPPILRHLLLADDRGMATVVLDRRRRFDEDVWTVVDGGTVLNTFLEWEYEPQPSSRDDNFFSRTRFSHDAALDLWKRFVVSLEFPVRCRAPSYVFRQT